MRGGDGGANRPVGGSGTVHRTEDQPGRNAFPGTHRYGQIRLQLRYSGETNRNLRRVDRSLHWTSLLPAIRADGNSAGMLAGPYPRRASKQATHRPAVGRVETRHAR